MTEFVHIRAGRGRDGGVPFEGPPIKMIAFDELIVTECED
jgi:hypothetical protein